MTLLKRIISKLMPSEYWRTIAGFLITVVCVHLVGVFFLPDFSSFGAMLVYATVGIVLISLTDKLWIKPYDILRSLFIERNVAVGLAVLGVCIIIAAAITRS